MDRNRLALISLAIALSLTLVCRDLHARIYAQGQGRFISRDPIMVSDPVIGTTPSPGLFTYANGVPFAPEMAAPMRGRFGGRDPLEYGNVRLTAPTIWPSEQRLIVGDTQGNIYQYVGASPVAYRDPYGLGICYSVTNMEYLKVKYSIDCCCTTPLSALGVGPLRIATEDEIDVVDWLKQTPIDIDGRKPTAFQVFNALADMGKISTCDLDRPKIPIGFMRVAFKGNKEIPCDVLPEIISDLAQCWGEGAKITITGVISVQAYFQFRTHTTIPDWIRYRNIREMGKE